jgi:hypothetical protein
MSHSLALDTLAYAKRLKQAGFTEQQAEVQAEIQAETLANLVDDKLVTKQDLKNELKALELRLTVRFGLMLAASIGIIAALIKLL